MSQPQEAKPVDPRSTTAQYLTTIGQAPFRGIAPYLSPVCPDCGQKRSPDTNLNQQASVSCT